MVSYQPNILLKAMSILLLAVLVARPSAYHLVWQQRNWYVIILIPIAVGILLPWCVRVLLWRVRINSATIEIRSPRGVLKRGLADLAEVDRLPGHVLVSFVDGSRRDIPAMVGDLNRLTVDIRRHLARK